LESGERQPEQKQDFSFHLCPPLEEAALFISS
jgi:hypothetical protein